MTGRGRGEPTHLRMFTQDYQTGHVQGAPFEAPQLALPVDEEQIGEVRVYRLHFPYVPPSKNDYDGWPWQYQHGVKAKWKKAVIRQCESLMIPKGNVRIGLAAALIFPTARRRDASNYSGPLWNFVPDGLQEAGVLVDDRDGAIDYGSNLGIRFHIDDRKTLPDARRKRTQVTLSIHVPG